MAERRRSGGRFKRLTRYSRDFTAGSCRLAHAASIAGAVRLAPRWMGHEASLRLGCLSGYQSAAGVSFSPPFRRQLVAIRLLVESETRWITCITCSRVPVRSRAVAFRRGVSVALSA